MPSGKVTCSFCECLIKLAEEVILNGRTYCKGCYEVLTEPEQLKSTQSTAME